MYKRETEGNEKDRLGKKERERAHARACVGPVTAGAIVCAVCAGAHKSVGSPPAGATLHLLLPLDLYLLLLPAGPADTHVYVYLGLQCKI